MTPIIPLLIPRFTVYLSPLDPADACAHPHRPVMKNHYPPRLTLTVLLVYQKDAQHVLVQICRKENLEAHFRYLLFAITVSS